jgi:hypothetical protein
MERVEVVGGEVFVLRTRQLGPTCWCCDLYERCEDHGGTEEFLFEDFGESELEAIAMALNDAHDASLQRPRYRF